MYIMTNNIDAILGSKERAVRRLQKANARPFANLLFLVLGN